MRPHKRFHHSRHRRKRGEGFLFIRLFMIFGFLTLLLIGGITVISFIFQNVFRGFQGGHHRPFDVGFFLIVILAFALIMIGKKMSRFAQRGIAKPLTDIMNAAEAVTQGNLSVRVKENRRGIFGRLGTTFNKMLVELEQTEQQRRSLAADVAHELNTPLHIIQGYLEGILDEVYQPDEETINTMLEETRLLSRLVEDLRTISLAESGVLPLQVRLVVIAELLEDIRTTFSGQAEASGLEIDINIEEGLTIMADPDRLNQVLINLMANAIRYSSKGDKITITTKQKASNLEIEVKDTGRGIDPEDLPHIFQRFWRADKSRTHADGSGHGLGLSIAQQLVRAHGGEIRAESEIGVGTKFIISLPMP